MEANQTREKFSYGCGIINLGGVFCLVWLIWYIFMDPNTVLKLYTPMYGFSLVVTLLASIVLLAKVAGSYPFHQHPTGRLGRGVVLTASAVVLTLFLVYVVFWGFIGKFGVAYFSPSSIVASGGIGAEPFSARENTSTAIVYFFGAFLWLALFWDAGFGDWPWENVKPGVRAWSRLSMVLILTIVAYVVLFHPHICYLFYPAQDKAGVEPWWGEAAQTGSAFYSLGWVLCALSWIVASNLLWEGYPWKLFEKRGESTFVKGLFTFLGTLIVGFIVFYIMLRVMNVVWDEAFMGGQYTDAPYFRYLHAGEISGFFILSAFIIKVYFNNISYNLRLWPAIIVRTLIAAAGTALLYLFYYSSATVFFLGKVPGVAQPDDTPLVWTLLFLSVILIQVEFFKGWPMKKRDPESHG